MFASDVLENFITCLTYIEGNIIEDNRYYFCRNLKFFLPMTISIWRDLLILTLSAAED